MTKDFNNDIYIYLSNLIIILVSSIDRRSTEEIFALFISIAFVVDAGRDVYKSKLTQPPPQKERKEELISTQIPSSTGYMMRA